MFQVDDSMELIDWYAIIQPFTIVIILIILMVLMIILYMKLRIFVVILTVFLFSIILGINAISFEFMPFNPYFSIFFILFQTIIFFLTSMKVFTYGKE